ncbi:MAG TPA: MgtC/SapB family protein [Tepidisphaeraceae bacterium]|jgi:putative Mg2+ transporter-C (MgtC) family protein|nr:MgtC/SapB family protein [Tepidisphaeraceae bacterium]
MPVTLDWQHVALRIALTVAAGLIIGFNRSEHGRPAGMRTTLLVCLAASLSMIQANLLMNTVGKAHDSFVVLDLMRLPLGILSGMGFIGAGTILRKENLVVGVTTAATLWFTTVMGLCFGGGQLGLGTAALVLGCGTLWGLKHLEKSLRQDVRATLTLSMLKDGPTEEEIRAAMRQCGCAVLSWGTAYLNRGERRELRIEVERRTLPGDTQPPAFVSQFAQNARIENVQWLPQGIPTNSGSQQPQPQGTPIAISRLE